MFKAKHRSLFAYCHSMYLRIGSVKYGAQNGNGLFVQDLSNNKCCATVGWSEQLFVVKCLADNAVLRNNFCRVHWKDGLFSR